MANSEDESSSNDSNLSHSEKSYIGSKSNGSHVSNDSNNKDQLNESPSKSKNSEEIENSPTLEKEECMQIEHITTDAHTLTPTNLQILNEINDDLDQLAISLSQIAPDRFQVNEIAPLAIEARVIPKTNQERYDDMSAPEMTIKTKSYIAPPQAYNRELSNITNMNTLHDNSKELYRKHNYQMQNTSTQGDKYNN